MRTLILSCNTGQGHNSCAKAIAEVYINNGDECEICDALSFLSKRISVVISGSFTNIYRYCPALFKFGYRHMEKKHTENKKTSLICRMVGLGSKKLAEYITKNGFDCVISTHTFAALMLTSAKNRYNLPIKTSFVATDYTCYPFTDETSLDYYFISDSETAKSYEASHISHDKIICSGIPVRQMFYDSLMKQTAKDLFDIPQDHRHLIIMGGSMGCGPIRSIAKNIIENLDDKCDVTILCGTNKSLYQKIKNDYIGNKNVHVRGYTDDISHLMDSADLYFTKPGGISVTEAAVKHLPSVFMNTVAGCEEYNMDYFINIGLAATADSFSDLGGLCVTLLNDKAALKDMSDSSAEFTSLNSAEVIYNCMKGSHTYDNDRVLQTSQL